MQDVNLTADNQDLRWFISLHRRVIAVHLAQLFTKDGFVHREAYLHLHRLLGMVDCNYAQPAAPLDENTTNSFAFFTHEGAFKRGAVIPHYRNVLAPVHIEIAKGFTDG